MQTKFGREICDRPRAKNSRVLCSPRPVCFEIFPMAAIRIVNAAMQHQLLCPALNTVQRDFAEHQYGIVIDLFESDRVEIAQETCRVMIPTPPEITSQGPQTFESRS